MRETKTGCNHGACVICEQRIELLGNVAEAAKDVDLDCEEVESADGMMMLVPIDVMHKLSDALAAAGYLED